MHRKYNYVINRFAILSCVFLFIFSAQANENSFEDQIRERFESAMAGTPMVVKQKTLHAQEELIRYYSERLYQPAWSNSEKLTPSIQALRQALAHTEEHGMNPEVYHTSAITELLTELNSGTGSSSSWVDLDLLLTDAFLTYSSHILFGQVNPETLRPEWRAGKRSTDLLGLLKSSLENNSVEESLAQLIPRHAGYQSLLKTLSVYRSIQRTGGWTRVPEGSKLTKGTSDNRIIPLRQRLIATGDASPEDNTNSKIYDDKLKLAVVRFQKRHGLEADGVIGAATQQALNISVEERIGQIIANLERWRWLPSDLGTRHIMVNIPGYKLTMKENDKTVLEMPVIVGKITRETPIFTENMTYLVINPTWTVPKSIAGKDKLPILRRDPSYLKRHNMVLYSGQGANAVEINPYSVNWSGINPNNFPFRIVQKPGSNNALGKIKFMLPNKHNVYLHDTSEPTLFKRSERSFSSGCIRVSQPHTLLNAVLENNTRLAPEVIQNALKSTDKKTVTLLNPIPVHISYWTAWANEDASVNFLRDIYDRDRQLMSALEKITSVKQTPTLPVPTPEPPKADMTTEPSPEPPKADIPAEVEAVAPQAIPAETKSLRFPFFSFGSDKEPLKEQMR